MNYATRAIIVLCAGLVFPGCGLFSTGWGETEGAGELELDEIMWAEPADTLRPASREAAAALHQRGDALFVDGAFIYHGASSGLVIYERRANGVFFKGALHLPGAVTDLAGQGDVLAVSCGPHGLFMIDLGDRSAPEIVSRLRFVGAVHRLHWEGPRMTAALGTMGVVLLGMGKPRAPRLLAYWPSEGMVRHAVRVNKKIFVAEGRAGVAVLDYKPGRGLSLAARLGTEGSARALWAHEELLFVAEGTVGISVWRMGDDQPLERMATLAMGDTARDVFFDGQRLLTALGDRGVAVIDVSDPAAPQLSARFENDRPVNRVRKQDELVFLGNDSSGLVILRWQAESPEEFEPVFPASGEGR